MQLQIKGYHAVVAVTLLTSCFSAWAESPSTDKNFAVTTIVKTETHPQFGKGSPAGYAVNGDPAKVPVLERGKTYTFNVDTGQAHDFYIATKPKGWGGDTLTDGVQGQFTYKGDVTFKPSEQTPDVVFLACRNHQYMGGEVHIVGGKK